MEDSREEETGVAGSLAQYRPLYESYMSGVPETLPLGDIEDSEPRYTQADSGIGEPSNSSQMQSEDDQADEFVRHGGKKTAETKRKKRLTVVREDEEEFEEEEEPMRPSHPTQDVGGFRSTQHVEPTLPENMTKDEQFLQAASKAKRKNKGIDEFDLEFNALKIAKPSKPSVASNVETTASRDRQTDEQLFRLVEDMDTSTTGNFIVIERMDLYRKDKPTERNRPSSHPEWAGKKNFKKFKQVGASVVETCKGIHADIVWLPRKTSRNMSLYRWY